MIGVEVSKSFELDKDDLSPGDLPDFSDEVFLAGTSCGVIGIVQVNGKPIGSGKEGPITKQIREAYRKLTRGAE